MQGLPIDQSPFDVVSPLIVAALDPNGTPATRDAAIDALRHLSEPFLRSLAMDADWALVLRSLAGEKDLPELAGDGPWSEQVEADASTEPAWREVAETGSAAPAARRVPVLGLHINDIRWLVGDDFRAPTELPGRIPRPDEPLFERLRLSAASLPVSPAEAAHRIGETAAVRLITGVALLEAVDQRGMPRDVAEEFWSTVLPWRIAPGVPPHLARFVLQATAGRRDQRDWFEGVAESAERLIDTELLDFLSVDDLTALHFRLRLDVAERARFAEVLDPALLAAADLFVIVRLLQAAARKDLALAWAAGKGRAGAATTALHKLNAAGELVVERALYAVARQPEAAQLAALSPRQWQALAVQRAARERDRDAQERGYLAKGPI